MPRTGKGVCQVCGGPCSWGFRRCLACYNRQRETMARGSRSRGYVWVKAPGHHRANARGYVKRAILVMEEKLGRPLRPEEMVHHINEIRDDDRPENLEARSRAGHHRAGHLQRLCPICGQVASVKDVRRRMDGTIVRYRNCPNGHRWKAEER